MNYVNRYEFDVYMIIFNLNRIELGSYCQIVIDFSTLILLHCMFDWEVNDIFGYS